MLSQVTNRVSKYKGRAATTALEKYRASIVELANGMHIAGHLVPLTDVSVTPRFFTARPPFNPLAEDQLDFNPLSLIPLTVDFPQAFASYELPGFPLKGLLSTSNRVALLGFAGSGRSTSLALIALQTALQVDDQPNPNNLFDYPALPILANFQDFDFGQLAFDQENDVLQPLFEAAAVQLKSISNRVIDMLRNVTALGHVVILIDDWESLPSEKQQEATEWLVQLSTQYPLAKIVIAGPTLGHKRLQDIGFAPIYIMPWGPVAQDEVVQKWREAWPMIGGQPEDPAPIPDANTVKRTTRNLRGRSPLDTILRVWATYAGNDSTARQVDWYDAYITRTTPAPYLLKALHTFAAETLFTDKPDNSYDRFVSLIDAAQAKGDGASSVRTSDFAYSLLNESRILQQFNDGTLGFRHAPIQAYLAAKTITEADAPDIIPRRKARLVMPFLAQLRDVSDYAAQQITEPNDLLLSNILGLALWMPDSDPEAAWRTEVMKTYARLFLAGETFPLVRERTMAALVSTLDVNTAFIFERGLQDDDPKVRLLSALGLGALGDPENVVLLGQATNDTDGGVQVAACLGLGAIGNKAALTYMLQMFVTGDEMARRAVAEMLSTNVNGEGHEILREALDEPDALTRKATVYALERVDKPWVIEQLTESERHDGQFIIRSAATDILERIRSGAIHGGDTVEQPENTEWVVAYYEQQNQAVRPGQAGIFQVVDLLTNGSEVQQLAAAELLGALGAAEAIVELYNALNIKHPEIRDSVYQALGRISLKTGEALPAVV